MKEFGKKCVTLAIIASFLISCSTKQLTFTPKYIFFYGSSGTYVTKNDDMKIEYLGEHGETFQKKIYNNNNSISFVAIDGKTNIFPTYKGVYNDKSDQFLNVENGTEILIQGGKIANGVGWLEDKKMWYMMIHGYIGEKGTTEGTLRFGTEDSVKESKIEYTGYPLAIGNDGNSTYFFDQKNDGKEILSEYKNQSLCTIKFTLDTANKECVILDEYSKNQKLSWLSIPKSISSYIKSNQIYFIEESYDGTDFYEGISKDGTSYIQHHELKLVKMSLDNPNVYTQVQLEKWEVDNSKELTENVGYDSLNGGNPDILVKNDTLFYMNNQNIYQVSLKDEKVEKKIPLPKDVTILEYELAEEGAYLVTVGENKNGKLLFMAYDGEIEECLEFKLTENLIDFHVVS